MSQDVRKVEITIPADWWTLAAAFGMLVLPKVYAQFRAEWRAAFSTLPELPGEIQSHSGVDPDRAPQSYRYDVFVDLSAAHEPLMRRADLGRISFAGTDSTTDIWAVPATPWMVLDQPLSLAPFWGIVVEDLQGFAHQARDLRRRYTPTAEQAIERYYRSRAAGSRITLRQIAAETGISYSTLTKHKMQYDANHRWGAEEKKRKT